MSDEPGNSPKVTEHPSKSQNKPDVVKAASPQANAKCSSPKYYTCTPDPPKLG